MKFIKTKFSFSSYFYIADVTQHDIIGLMAYVHTKFDHIFWISNLNNFVNKHSNQKNLNNYAAFGRESNAVYKILKS